MREWDHKKFQAKFYKFACYWKWQSTTNNARKNLASLKSNLKALEQKHDGRIGGIYWAPRYKWLINQL